MGYGQDVWRTVQVRVGNGADGTETSIEWCAMKWETGIERTRSDEKTSKEAGQLC